jgi:protein-ribulosamine 3-kinase
MRFLLEEAQLAAHVEVDSAGTGAWHVGEPPDRRARDAGKRRGIRIHGRARKVVVEDFESFHYVIAMDRSNQSDLYLLAPDEAARAKVELLRNFDPASPRDAEVPDPYYGGGDGFERVLRATLERTLGHPVTRAAGLGGGSINDAYEVTLGNGSRIFVKTHRNPPAGMFEAEARGLRWLAKASAIRVPGVVAVSDARPAFLALELLSPARRRSDFDEQLGRSLAALHAFGALSFGLDHDNFIGRLAQSNTPDDDWPSFYWGSRLEPQLRLATDRGLIDAQTRSRFAALSIALPELVGPEEPPSRLHGDLWAGNLHVDELGAPCVIDPAVYGGHREVDLAMMRLFGGFGPRVFAAYEEVFPLAEGAPSRVPLYQLYPLLVHVNLFGGSYVGSVKQALLDMV